MNLEEIDKTCQTMPGCTVRYPFESSPNLRAWCINTRMFAWSVTHLAPLTVQVKANPDLIPSLIENYDCIQPGYHMNKKHWITINAADCETAMLKGLLEDAHALIVDSLPKRDRLQLLSD